MPGEPSPFAEMADKLERQPVHDSGVILAPETRDEAVDLFRQADALRSALRGFIL